VDIFGNRIRGPNEVVLECSRELLGDVLSVHLSQKARSSANWTLTIYVQIAQGWYQLGKRLTINSPSAGDPPARTVAFGCCPGAIGWKVLATCATPGEIAELVLQSSKCGGNDVFGVTQNFFTPIAPPDAPLLEAIRALVADIDVVDTAAAASLASIDAKADDDAALQTLIATDQMAALVNIRSAELASGVLLTSLDTKATAEAASLASLDAKATAQAALVTLIASDEMAALTNIYATGVASVASLAILAANGAAWTRSLTAALSFNFIAKAMGGRFRSAAGRLDATAPTGTYYIQVWDLAAPPADSTAVSSSNSLAAPMKIQHSNGAEDYWEIEVPDPGLTATNGIVIGLSSTEFTKTATAAYLSATACFR